MFDDDAAHGVARAERADDTSVARNEIVAMQMKGDDRSGRTGVGVLIQDHRRLAFIGNSPNTPLAISWFILRLA